MRRMSFTQELKALAKAGEGMDAPQRQCEGQTRGDPTTNPRPDVSQHHRSRQPVYT